MGFVHRLHGHRPTRERIVMNFPNVLTSLTGRLVMLATGIVCQLGSTTAFSAADSVAVVLRAHCVRCHGGEGEAEADVDLSGLRREDSGQHADLISRIIQAIDRGEMPPEDEPQIAPKQRTRLLADLRTLLAAAAENHAGYPHTPVRRMNRFQYNNAVVDLFQLNCIVFTLPERMMREHKGYFRPESGKMPDVVTVGSRPLGKSQMIEPRLAGVAAFPQDLRAEHGFDNRGDHLSLSPMLMESFLRLGQSITQSPDFGERSVGIWDDFFAAPEADPVDVAEIRRRLEPFLTSAFRGPVDAASLDRYTDYVMRQLARDVDFTEAMKSVAAATIASPRFLYLYDKHDDESPGSRVVPCDDFELAARLSFFLWGSLPDAELLELAAAARLSDPDVLTRQIDRMLRDQKIKRFCDSFPAQWLQLERIISAVPDPERFPNFYFAKYRNSMHMMLEPLLLFETVLVENRSIEDLVDADFSYRSKLLEKAYGELTSGHADEINHRGGGTTTLEFRRVPLPDRRTGGVITNAAVMTMTSGPRQTKPITRGAWVAGVIFNNPPDPPPADVPPLDEDPPPAEHHLTLRERLALHRERADCRGCHEKIDPLGFALENYDPVGRWRDGYENGRNVDVAGRLFRQHEFRDIVQFKDAILAEKDRFAKALASHLLTFAVARPLSVADDLALDRIVAAAADADGRYPLQDLIRQVVLSEPFRVKTRPRHDTTSDR